MEHFKIALSTGPGGENELFDSDNSNFGLPVPTDVKTYKLDSVIYVSDTVSVIVVKEYRRKPEEAKNLAKLWREGKDTLYHDPLLGRKHSLDSIKTVLKTTGNYINPVEKIVFIGYDNKKTKNKKNNSIPFTIINDNNNHSPFDMQLALMLGMILLLSLLGGWLSWRFYQPGLEKV